MRSEQVIQKAESGARKIRELTDGWAILFSGPLDFGDGVAFDTEKRYIESRKSANDPNYRLKVAVSIAISGRIPPPPPMMAECAKSAYQVARRALAVDEILVPHLLTEKWYEDKTKAPIARDDYFCLKISEDLSNYDTRS